jgi:hypothetical protein
MRMFNTAEMKCVVSDSEVLVMLVTLVDEGTARNISERLKVI